MIHEELAASGETVAGGEVWRLLTSGFLHFGAGHLLFNMLSLYILGRVLETEIGRLRFAFIYFESLLAGSFGGLLLEPMDLSAGASGAIFGLFPAGVMVMHNQGISPTENGLLLWLGLSLAFTFLDSSISIGGHLGGLAGGALAALLFEVADRLPSRGPRVERLLEVTVLMLVVVVGALAVVGSIVISDN
ncbi:MAG: rhomboid family intramembrane serine protease [Actinomycetota bacterium]|nr:rhomboid family intramembrane serine protease [Actinomycetota bacterium]